MRQQNQLRKNMDIQSWMDSLSQQWKRERANSQMTLGGLIARLQELPQDMEMDGIGEPRSYRGYYSDLAFESLSKRKVSEVLKDAQSAMGREFKGYKGGDYMMGESTPIWMASYGCCGLKIMEILADGTIITKEDEY